MALSLRSSVFEKIVRFMRSMFCSKALVFCVAMFGVGTTGLVPAPSYAKVAPAEQRPTLHADLGKLDNQEMRASLWMRISDLVREGSGSDVSYKLTIDSVSGEEKSVLVLILDPEKKVYSLEIDIDDQLPSKDVTRIISATVANILDDVMSGRALPGDLSKPSDSATDPVSPPERNADVQALEDKISMLEADAKRKERELLREDREREQAMAEDPEESRQPEVQVDALPPAETRSSRETTKLRRRARFRNRRAQRRRARNARASSGHSRRGPGLPSIAVSAGVVPFDVATMNFSGDPGVRIGSAELGLATRLGRFIEADFRMLYGAYHDPGVRAQRYRSQLGLGVAPGADAFQFPIAATLDHEDWNTLSPGLSSDPELETTGYRVEGRQDAWALGLRTGVRRFWGRPEAHWKGYFGLEFRGRYVMDNSSHPALLGSAEELDVEGLPSVWLQLNGLTFDIALQLAFGRWKKTSRRQ